MRESAAYRKLNMIWAKVVGNRMMRNVQPMSRTRIGLSNGRVLGCVCRIGWLVKVMVRESGGFRSWSSVGSNGSG